MMVGALTNVGRKSLTEEIIEKWLKSDAERITTSKVTAPPEGLFLKHVYY
jgi:tRNA U38,U39,U40 pseudouridine synthase TruA